MKKYLLFIFVCTLLFSSCSQGTSKTFDSFETFSQDTIESDSLLLSTDSLLSGLTYKKTNIRSEICEISGTSVVLPILPTEELNTSLKLRLEEFLASLDLSFKPKTVDFQYEKYRDIESFLFYIADSPQLYDEQKLCFVYETSTHENVEIGYFFDEVSLNTAFAEKYNITNFTKNRNIEGFYIFSNGINIISDSEVYYFPFDYLFKSDKFSVFHPDEYEPVTNREEKYIALTFDDGPNPYTTLPLLEMLENKGVKATFFMVGYNVEEYPHVVKTVYSKGHDIGIHSYRHSNFFTMKFNEVIADLDKCSDLIFSLVGKRPYLVRPPFGNINREEIDTPDYFFVNWNVDPLDWKYDSAEIIAENVIKYTQSGSIILLHDIYETSCDAAEIVIDKLLEDGYRFVTISEYFDLNNKKNDNKLHFFAEDYNVEQE
ncbi:MAG: hypothetical protein E7582_02970 [Ruminococcaceae bacterium]|nr:hypothetical protein [Oscillospiraceae bacterium]